MHEGAIAFAAVEANGIKVDTDYLERTARDLDKRIGEHASSLRSRDLWDRWVHRFGVKSNLDSLNQLGHLLFDPPKTGGLGYSCKARTATGRAKVDESAVERVGRDKNNEDAAEFCTLYTRWKKLCKARSTYVGGIARETVDGFLHPFINLHLTETFRSSSSEPNFQNMPVRNKEIGDLIRRIFISRFKNGRVADIDFSGIEVKVAACYHKDPNMMTYIRDPETDMHRDTAMKLFNLNKEQVSKAARHTAKNRFVFPQFYGDYYVSCAKNIWEESVRRGLAVEGSNQTVQEHLADRGIKKLGKCDPDKSPKPGTFEYQVKQIEDWFWQQQFKVYTRWKKEWWREYLKRGYFSMYTGFVCQGVYRRNQVINYPVQGAAFHCLLWSLIKLQKWLTRHKMKSCVVGQIHDSLVLDLHPKEVQDVLTVAYRVMTKSLLKAWDWIIVPMDVEVEVSPEGGSWADKQVWNSVSGTWQLKV